ncbi:MAG TPA: PD-(D/E)XK nuclease family protein [Gammaproteobacteria bacterium]|nr:PD-(D/E)XK nuclease family protein [Gammaproteobacteria bacterium]
MPTEIVTLTVNQRLARYLRVQYAKNRRDAGEPVSEPPPIYSWAGWLREQYTALQNAALQGGAPPPVLLSTPQAELLWESILTASPYGGTLLRPAATARAARSAWVLGKQWRLDPALLERNDLPDVLAFAAWSRAYEQRCAAQGWLDNAELAAYLTPVFASQQLMVPATIELAGFDDITPQQQTLLDTLSERGCHIVTQAAQQAADSENYQAQRIACRDAEAEIHAAAKWARHCLQRNPAAHIAIVVPELAAQRSRIARHLEEALQPTRRLLQTYTPPPFNISLGEPLSDVPLIATALQALSLAVGPLAYEQVSSLLRSPFITGTQTDNYAGAALDVTVRQQRQVRMDLSGLTHLSKTTPVCAILSANLQSANKLCHGWRNAQTPDQWAQCFAQFLAALGWSQGRKLDSVEYQALDAWQSLLAEFGSLGLVGDTWRASQAVAQLRRLASNTLFQTQTPATQVEVLGVLEAVGQQFDHVWVMGLHDNIWPAAPRPDPFLPRHWQRQANVPHSSARREYDYAQRLTKRLLQLAPDITISWPQSENGTLLRPSPLISHLPRLDDTAFDNPISGSIAEREFDARRREPIPETRLPVVPENTAVRGGTWLLADQAACPFRAMAKHRWQADELEQPAIGLNAADRGALVHQLMAILWNQLGSQAALKKLTPQQRETVIAKAAKQTVDDWCRKQPGVLEGRFRVLEEKRLATLATEWLAIETTRSDFTVAPAETEQQFSIGGLQLRARPDRIDRLADNSEMVIDYKTGEASINSWLGERPDAPQLPLYALANRQKLAGVLFASLQRGKARYLGLTREEAVVPGATGFESWRQRPDDCADFDGLLDNWQRDLDQLAQNYRQGDALVDPKLPTTCRYCHLSTLCRINEQVIADDDGADVENGGTDNE